MKFTTKSRYALNALIELHLLEIDGPVKISKIADMQSIEILTWSNFLESYVLQA